MEQTKKGFQTQNINSVLYEYSVKMDQIAENGTITMTHKLVSDYRMTPLRQAEHPSIFDASYEILNMFYTPNGKKPMEWKFAKDKSFTSVLFNMTVDGSVRYIADEGINLLYGQMTTVQELFKQFPKLPATGLIHAFVYDLIGMDQMLSHIVSSGDTYSDFDDRKPINTLDNKAFDFSVGVYEEGSEYKNGDMNAVFLGEAIYAGRKTLQFGFSCDNASFRMSDRHKEKNGFSYYRGTLAIDDETGILYGADMTEYIFSDTNQLMRRNVMMKAKEIDSI